MPETTAVTGQRRQYARPPVLEAIVDIQVEPAESLETATLLEFHAGREDRFPMRSGVMTGAVKIDVAAGSVVQSKQSLIGYRFADTAQTRVVAVRMDGYAFSRLAPYSRWEDWIDEARELWNAYVDIASPRAVTRVAVRYINRIDFVPRDGDRIHDYLSVYPHLPDELPQIATNFLVRLELPQQDIEASVTLTVGKLEPPEPSSTALLLDLNVFKLTGSLPTAGAEVWDLVNVLHDRENFYFETCITDRAREIFADAVATR